MVVVLHPALAVLVICLWKCLNEIYFVVRRGPAPQYNKIVKIFVLSSGEFK